MSETLLMPPVSPSLLRDRVESQSACGWGVLVPTILLLRTLVFSIGVISVHTVHSLNQIDPSNASGFPWVAFDSHFYRYILLHGYPPGPEVPYQIAYFPLFPILARAFLPIFQLLGDPQTASHSAMLAFSNLCSIVGLCFFYAWVRKLTTARTALIAAVLLTLYPGSVFFSAGLTEGMFMMFVAIVIYLLQQQRVYAAATVSAFATACRPTAVSLAITIVIWTIVYSWSMPKRQLLLRVLLIGSLSVAGAASYQCYIWHRYQRFDAYKVSEDRWDLDTHPIEAPENQLLIRGVDQVWTSANLTVLSPSYGSSAAPVAEHPDFRRYSKEFFIDRLTKTSVWNRAIALVLCIVMFAAVFQKTPFPRQLLAIPLIIFMMSYLPNNGLRASSILRYETAGIPLFAVLALWLSAPSRKPLLLITGGVSLAVQLYYAFLFSRGFWVG